MRPISGEGTTTVRSLTLFSLIVTTLYSNHNAHPTKIGLSLFLDLPGGNQGTLCKSNDILGGQGKMMLDGHYKISEKMIMLFLAFYLYPR